eukprot:3115378-Rhodomonas_salina.1
MSQRALKRAAEGGGGAGILSGLDQISQAAGSKVASLLDVSSLSPEITYQNAKSDARQRNLIRECEIECQTAKSSTRQRNQLPDRES